VAGGMNQRQNRRVSAAQQQQAAAAQSQRATAWTNSNVGCLQARGYAVEKAPVAGAAAASLGQRRRGVEGQAMAASGIGANCQVNLLVARCAEYTR
jgi:hypothetical protein